MSIWAKIKKAFGGGSSSSSSSKKKSSGKGSGGGSTTASLTSDIKMGAATFGQSYEKAAETLAEKGYSGAAIDSYISRTKATQAAAAARTSSRDDSDNKRTTAAPTPAPEPEPDPTPVVDTTPEVTTVLPEKVDDALTQVEDIAEVTFPTDEQTTALEEATGEKAADLQTQYVPEAVKEDISASKPAGTTTISTGSAAGGRTEAAAARPTSVGKAEDKAIDFYEKGRRSTILTKPTGLLGSGTEERQTRRRRSLIGG
jgi:hypothetical protein